MASFKMERLKKMKVIEIAEFIVFTKCTVRQAAKEFKISKSTVYRYMIEELPKHSILLTRKIRNVLNLNKMDRHIRGGIATKLKYENIRSKK